MLYQIALSLTPSIGPVQAKLLVDHMGSASAVFKAKVADLKNIDGIGEVRIRSIKKFDKFNEAEEEIKFIEQYKISPLFITDTAYPQRLLNCYDSPVLLYYKGTTDLNKAKIVSVIGTRNHTEYGKQLTETLVKELAAHDILVVSGLAYGIDAIAHKAALKNNLPTVGVLAHGLDQVYPLQHKSLAKDMIRQGGLLTEFRSRTKPDKHNFPTRNRIVAGMSDATIVIETGIKGGSIITAELANGYNKEVFAFPGKTTDSKSTGCNWLIKQNKAMLLTDAEQLLQTMNWQPAVPKKRLEKQRELFIELTAGEKIIVNILKERETVHIDEINQQSGLNSSAVAAAILGLELQNVVVSLPGKLYQLA